MSNTHRHTIRLGALVLGLVLSVALVFAVTADHSWDAGIGAQIRPAASAPSAFIALGASGATTAAAIGVLASLCAVALAGGVPAAARRCARPTAVGATHPASHPFVLRI